MKYESVIQLMTLSEKCGMLSGLDMWHTKAIRHLGIQSVCLADGPSGLRKQAGKGDRLGLNASVPATCWPAAAAVACSWDPELAAQVGTAIGLEAIAQGVGVVLAPGLNIKRSPLYGRNFEYFSEDPYLAGKMAAAFIRGLQSQKVAACPKHFAVNNQELLRMASDSQVDERTLREIYLTNFEIAVKEGQPKALMTSYNRVNGTYANENEHLLRDILAQEWGFQGAVITDWGGSNDHVAGVTAGSHLEMPSTGADSDRQLEQAVLDGRIPESLIDDRVDTLLDLIFAVTSAQSETATTVDLAVHHDLARQVAEQSIVLLKNQDDILPLHTRSAVAIIGDMAAVPRYQGAGSSLVNPTKVESIMDVITQFDLTNIGYAAGYRRDGRPDPVLQERAVELARGADVVLLALGLPENYETEGLDRSHMRLPEAQESLIRRLADVNPRIVVILQAGSPVEMPWIDRCMALVHSYLGGQAGASAVLRVITGQVNPSGKLAETYPLRYEDTPVSAYFPGQQRTAEYREGLYVGYRYFETVGDQVRFPFGYGLSYTTFEYDDLMVTPTTVTFTVKNTGMLAGAEVAQVYVGCPNSKQYRPLKELKGFSKVFLQPGESKTVVVPLDDKAFRYFDALTDDWEIETAEYQIMVGSNVHDIRLRAPVSVEGSVNQCFPDPEKLPSYHCGHVEHVTQAEFESLLGRPVPDPNWDTTTLGMNDTIYQLSYARSRLARLIFHILTVVKDRSISKGTPNLDILAMYYVPFRGIAKLTGGLVTMDMAKALVVIVNGHFIKGFRQMVRAIRSKPRRVSALETDET